MSRLIRISSSKAGLPPGTVLHVGEKHTEAVRVQVFDFDEQAFTERTLSSAAECAAYRDKPTVTWINVDGVHDTALLAELGRLFNLHPLLLEDLANTNQRPKQEAYDDYLFVVVKMLTSKPGPFEVDIEQVSMVIGKNYVLSFQEKQGDVFDGVRDRIRGNKGIIRRMGADYLAYALIDAIVDQYFVLLERVGESMDDLDEQFLARPPATMPRDLHAIKREMLFLRKAVWPMREVIGGLLKMETPRFRPATVVYLRDLYDHVFQVIDAVETLRDLVSGLQDLYMSSVSHRMNEVMKVLTIIATIFIPLTFIAGVYGMNFEYMPELKWKAGYGLALGAMAATALAMLAYFRRKKWI